ncbi:MAG: rhamnogalacturonan lyase [Bacteroidetes bacterium]|uniref:rhamnogalacturonan lyase n=1 Tax=Phnomibacter sp. TaxID=2836217 RepID=UPI002FDD4324|nr:rhamnogalacturonan lyase [Bacteroidota bacterium]
MQKLTHTFMLLLCLLLAKKHQAQRIAEKLDRAVSAVPMPDGKVFVSWRWMLEDATVEGFNVYKATGKGKAKKLNTTLVTATTGFVDEQADSTQTQNYFVKAVSKGKEAQASAAFTLPAKAQPYFSIPLQTPQGYTPNDGSVADLDGDGVYEIILHQTGRAKDNSQAGITDPPIIQAFKMDGTLLWSINLGKNIREGAHYTQFMVYDLDGDGKAEVTMKTADGSMDGKGNIIGDSSKDWRNERGYILAGPEFLSVFNGLTGEVIHTVDYIPARHPSNAQPTEQELKAVWGDGYGNRMDRFLAAVAYLDGKHPSVIMCRGYYTRTVIAAWDFSNKKLQSRWVFDTDNGMKNFAGQGNHNLTVTDVDNDGKDEIVYGAMTVDDDGKGLYTTGIGHGDALHVSDLDPSRPGLEVFHIQERFGDAGANLRDAKTGEIIWKKASVKAGEDGEGPGRGLAIDMDPRYEGAECWVAGAGITGVFDIKGNKIADRAPACNMGMFWDGDAYSEILNGTSIERWDTASNKAVRIFDARQYNCVSNNGTKANPVLSADIWGDWREELIYRTADNNELRIFSTPIPTPHKLTTFLQDRQYRLSIVWQNVAYNQPPHTSFSVAEKVKALASNTTLANK